MGRSSGSGAYSDPHEDLYAQIEDRRRRRLFLPSILDQTVLNMQPTARERDAAYEIIRKWWQLAQDGKLNRKETTIDDRFLSEVFGQALGHRGVTETTNGYERERQFYVPNVGPCDGALGLFPPLTPESVRVVIELKGALTHLDRDKANGRTAIQQLWDYLNAMPQPCVWGIVSNFTTTRLYHRAKGNQVYEQFRLKELAQDRREFDRFYAILEPYGLFKPTLGRSPCAVGLLEQTAKEQREVGDDLYKHYSEQRLRLIEHLHRAKRLPLEAAIRISQKLIDRVLFIAFCEDRGLIAADAIESACKRIAAYDRTRNPVWRNFLGLFDEMNVGGKTIGVENGYNGGLFAEEKDYPIAGLDLDDVPWTEFFRVLAGFDYKHTVDVDVLGHLFEKSVTELERLRQGALLVKEKVPAEAPLMPKSPQRKLFGIYYTPVEFTTAIVAYTIDEIVAERFAAVQHNHRLTDEQVAAGTDAKAAQAYWRDCLEVLRNLKVCDPACGSAAFLIRAFDALFRHYTLVITELERLGEKKAAELLDDVPDEILRRNLYGVDLQPEAVEIAQLSLWLRTARHGRTLAKLSDNIVCGNSLTDDPAVHPRALDWAKTFPQVFTGDSPGFDCVIGNPPWERLKLQEREFFALSAPEIAAAVSAADRRKKIATMETANPELFALYREAIASAGRMLTYARKSKRYPLTGKGDINTYVLFAELAMRIVSPTGRVGLLVPSGIATDKTTARFFNKLTSAGMLRRLYDFENKRGLFADVHRSFKFSILNFGGPQAKSEVADFVFFARALDELKEPKRHIALSAADMKLMNPNTRTCPVFRTRHDCDLTKGIYRNIPILIDRNRKKGGNPWGLEFARIFDEDTAADSFVKADVLSGKHAKLDGDRWFLGGEAYLPLYEAKMVQGYDHRAASVVLAASNWMRKGQTADSSLVDHQNPEFQAMPVYWIRAKEVSARMAGRIRPAYIAFKKVTSATNQRTMIAAFLPYAAFIGSLPIIVFGPSVNLKRQCCLLANLNSMAYDFIARQKVGGLHLNFFIVEQLPTLPPDAYDEPCPWDRKQKLAKWVSSRVLKLSCTANDMKPLAKACGVKPPVHKWNPDERAALLAELDAAYFILYGLGREDMIYVLTTFQTTRSKGMPDLFQPDPDKVLSNAGRRIVTAYDALRTSQK